MNERAEARRGIPVKPWSGQGTLFVTGATGLLGGEALARILEGAPDLRAVALVRGMARWRRAARHHGFDGPSPPAARIPVTIYARDLPPETTSTWLERAGIRGW